MLDTPRTIGSLTRLAAPRPVASDPQCTSPSDPTQDQWKYDSPRHGAGTIAMAAFVSATIHLIALYGFNQPPKPEKKAVESDEAVIQLAMPDLKDLDEPEKVENLDDSEIEIAAVPVPMLVDMPTVIPIDAFVQQMDYKPPMEADLAGAKMMAIPVHVQRGGNIGERLGKIFDISQLDRIPEAVVQVAPTFPYSLKREVTEARVLVEFIVDAKGDVVAPFVVESSHRGFEESAVIGVAKWKFRPGMKGGKRVNTRMRVPLLFHVTND